MIEINSQEGLNNPELDSETELIASLIMDVFSVLFKIDDFSAYASLIVITGENDFDNYKDMHLYEKPSLQSFEFMDEIVVSHSGNHYLLGCIVPSDDFGVWLLINQKYNNLNLERSINSRRIILNEDSTYKIFLKSGTPDATIN